MEQECCSESEDERTQGNHSASTNLNTIHKRIVFDQGIGQTWLHLRRLLASDVRQEFVIVFDIVYDI
jgi:hypothetical protein